MSELVIARVSKHRFTGVGADWSGGWTDLDLRHGFYDTRQGRRFTIDPTVQVEILDRLLELKLQVLRRRGQGRAARHQAQERQGCGPPVAEEGTLFFG
ncbi:hypothetical protein [Actinophytocola gossypii]|uniref:Uncharacterized protein n=1 Tax=Actinophytocola gossypii TaxID=2812003 RepID=A0ABT2J448_9PSEU|nr:hypothetical protein [Actinophytocola gossypii]MCT2582364.1 hypothetical protein [Actinophytocola gossypii]